MALDIGIHLLRDPWGLLRLDEEERVDLYAYRDALLSTDESRRASRRRAASGKATIEDLRLLSLAPLTESGALHVRGLIARARKALGRGREDSHHQTSGAEQIAQRLRGRGGDAARKWLPTLEAR